MFRFGAPLAVGMMLHTAFNLVDLFMISRLPEATSALAALGVCDMLAAAATILATGLSNASVALISRHVGAEDLRGVRRAAWQSLWLVGALSVVFGAVGIFGSDVVIRGVMHVKGEAAVIATGYLQVMLGGCFSIFLLLQLTAILRALGHAKTAAILLVGGNALNIVLNVFFIYGTGPAPEMLSWGAPVAEALGIPAMGAVGAAWATLIARTVPVLLGLWLLVRRPGGPRFHPVYLRPFRAELREIWRLGWPSSAQLVLRVGGILAFLALVGAEYTTAEDPSALTAFGICLRLETMVLFVGMGWGAAASSFVASNLGAGQRERALRAGWVAAGFDVLLMAGLSALYVRFGGDIVAFFDPSAEVVAIGEEYLGIVAWSYALLGAGVVLSQAIGGAGATVQSLLLDGGIICLLVLPAAYLASATFDGPRTWLWTVIAVSNVVGAVAFALYYATGRFLDASIGALGGR